MHFCIATSTTDSNTSTGMIWVTTCQEPWRSATNRHGNVGEFHIVWRVVGHPDYNGAQMYEQFLKVGQLYLAWFRSLSSEHLCIFGLLVWYILKKILVTFFTLAFSELGVVYWTLTWLTDHCPSVPWNCWLGRLTHTSSAIADKLCDAILLSCLRYCKTFGRICREQEAHKQITM